MGNHLRGDGTVLVQYLPIRVAGAALGQIQVYHAVPGMTLNLVCGVIACSSQRTSMKRQQPWVDPLV
jgi:hypothetical protein